MSINLIGITGKAGAGKDTVADYIVKEHNYRKYNLADPIKKALNAMFGWDMSYWDDREWKESPLPKINKSPRFLAQTLGTEWGREKVNEQIWLHIAEDLITSVWKEGKYNGVVIPDIRFDNEAVWLSTLPYHEEFNFVDTCKLVLVQRDKIDNVDNKGHASEKGVTVPIIRKSFVNNGSFEDLYSDVEIFMRGHFL